MTVVCSLRDFCGGRFKDRVMTGSVSVQRLLSRCIYIINLSQKQAFYKKQVIQSAMERLAYCFRGEYESKLCPLRICSVLDVI